MMKRTLNKLIKNERGQALLIVLVMMLMGGLIITPLLSYMSTGLRAGKVHEEKMAELYAADAGIQDAIHKMLADDPSLPLIVGENWTYYISNLNDKYVKVEIVLEEEAEEFVDDLLEENYSGVHEDWEVVSDMVGAGTYTLDITYTGAANNKKVDGIGVWFWGVYACTDNSSGVGKMTDNYPVYSFEQRDNYKGGTAFLWEWLGGNRPIFQPGDSMTQSMTFTPETIPAFYISWVVTGSADIGVVTSGAEFGTSKVIATATDNTTGGQTVVTSYITWSSDNISIINWEISLQ